MELRGAVIVITGGGRGIGAALARRFAREQPAGIVVGDLDGEAAGRVAGEVGGVGLAVDVRREEDTIRLIEAAREAFGPVDLFCANAGIAMEGGLDLDDGSWQRSWEVNTLAHLHAARHLVPEWRVRGGGYLLVTASAAGLLTSPGSAVYAVTKHAVVALAEWIAITHGDAGVRVSCLCPQGVRTDMLDATGRLGDMLRPGAIEPEEVADLVVEGLSDERFLILPHPEVAEYERRRAGDRDRWLAGMRKALSGR
ncbi:MAG: SDR family oxidoreductase [Acidimicrobiia bacterium]|jgi:NAD(P)-dependent dehydrogenase (short-subunit alcohol dehydrogenase family)